MCIFIGVTMNHPNGEFCPRINFQPFDSFGGLKSHIELNDGELCPVIFASLVMRAHWPQTRAGTGLWSLQRELQVSGGAEVSAGPALLHPGLKTLA